MKSLYKAAELERAACTDTGKYNPSPAWGPSAPADRSYSFTVFPQGALLDYLVYVGKVLQNIFQLSTSPTLQWYHQVLFQ